LPLSDFTIFAVHHACTEDSLLSEKRCRTSHLHEPIFLFTQGSSFRYIYIYIYTHTHSNIYLYINKFTYYMWLYNLIHRRQFSFWFPEGLTASCHAYPSLVWTITSTCSLNKVVTQGSYKMTLSLLLFWQIYSVQKTQQPNNAKSNNPLGKTSGLWD